jgi:diguanylate cyclase (GGDEF)-like protein
VIVPPPPPRERPFLLPDVREDRALLDAIAAQFRPLDGFRVPMWLFCPSRLQMVWANRAALAVWEARTLADMQARDLGADMSDAMRLSLGASLARIRNGETVREVSAIFPRGIGKRVQMFHHLVHLPDGTEGMLAEVDVEPPAEDLVQLASGLSLLLALFRADGTRVSMNPAFRALLAERIERLDQLLVDAMPVDALLASLPPVEPRGHDLELPTARGLRTFRVELRRVADKDDAPCVLASLYDVTTQRRERAELVRLATTDVLTGLANRHGVLQDAQARAARGENYDVLYLDLDGLKQLNDSLGHHVGDLALEAAARRIERAVPEGGFAGRLGGDEFVAFVPGDGEAVAERMRSLLSMPYAVDDLHVLLTASIGVTLREDLPEGAIEDRLRLADAALFEAKRAGRNRVQRAIASSVASEARLRRIHNLLPHAVQRGELRVVVQPIVRLADTTLARGEVLVRWNSPELGQVSPAEFVAIAEQSGMARELGRFVLGETTKLLQALAAAGHAVPLAVNLSGREVVLPTLASDIEEALTRTGTPPRLLTVELTESAMIGRIDLAREQLRKVRALGVGVALDDFGTGYSALSIVHELEVDTLKLDRSLVKDLPGPRAGAIVRAVVGLAETMGLAIVAEGVETEPQAEALLAMGCTFGQGYLWARPMEVEDFVARCVQGA